MGGVRKASAPRPVASQASTASISSARVGASGVRRSSAAARSSSKELQRAGAAAIGQFEESKQRYGKPSDRLTKIKTANPFGASTRKHKTNFGYAYG